MILLLSGQWPTALHDGKAEGNAEEHGIQPLKLHSIPTPTTTSHTPPTHRPPGNDWLSGCSLHSEQRSASGDDLPTQCWEFEGNGLS